jgi:hypothetical protein
MRSWRGADLLGNEQPARANYQPTHFTLRRFTGEEYKKPNKSMQFAK